MIQTNKPRPACVRPSPPVLRFSPTAWAKLLYLRDGQDAEVGAFGIAPADDLLYVQDIALVGQEVTVVSVAFDDEAVATFFEDQVAAGRRPEQFGRLWIHTHPGTSADPSGTDEETFARVFGNCQWAVMCILARGGKTTARLRFNVGPGGDVQIPVVVDYSRPFGPSDADAWQFEYDQAVRPAEVDPFLLDDRLGSGDEYRRRDVCPAWLEDLADLEPADRRQVLDELGGDPAGWREACDA